MMGLVLFCFCFFLFFFPKLFILYWFFSPPQLYILYWGIRASLVAQTVKNLPAM